MHQPLVLCVPNFSEGRRSDVIEHIVAAIAAVPGVDVLNHSSDPDHNRSVVTFVGAPDAVVEAAFAGIQGAAQLIDLDAHQGVHPRLGAADVVPFVPIAGVTLVECVVLARRLGGRVGDELNIPVYLYEAAATRPDRVNLEDVRRGQYEELKTTIGSDPARAPDFGPAIVGKAGATIIGARKPLIAFNVYLTTDDVSIAQKIATAVRHSSGGLRYVKALGLLVGGRSQVSLNLTDYTQTPVARVVEFIRREAARYGAAIHHTELIGLIPQAALVDAAQWYLQLDDFNPDQILESRLATVRRQQQDADFLEQLAQGTAAPGGGGAAAYAGAMAAALVAMVARLTLGKQKYASVARRMHAIASQADSLRADLTANVQRDSDAYAAVMAAYQLPKITESEQWARVQAVDRALAGAALVQLDVVRLTADVLALLAEVAEGGNINALPDVAAGGSMAGAAIQSSTLNVRANAASMTDKTVSESWFKTLAERQTQAAQFQSRIYQALRERVHFAIDHA